MPQYVAGVFIASTRGALDPYRDAAVSACHKQRLIPLYMEDFSPDTQPSIELCRRTIDESDVFLLILAHRYGARPSGESLSFTELEYHHAVARKKRVVVFLVDPRHPWTERDHDAADVAALNAFVRTVAAAHTVRHFGGVEDFKHDLLVLFGDLKRRFDVSLSRPFHFAGQWCSSSHELAEAMAIHWSLARELLIGPDDAGRYLLAHWLSVDVGDRTFPSNLLQQRAGTQEQADERILSFVAHFAPDIPPRFGGGPGDAAGLATLCMRAANGDQAAEQRIQELSESSLRSLARHRCEDRHRPGCGESGCQLLADAWPAFKEGMSAAAKARADMAIMVAPEFRSAIEKISDPQRIMAKLWRTVLDADYSEVVRNDFRQLPAAGNFGWWDRLYERAKGASGQAEMALILLLEELAAPAAELEAFLAVRRRRWFAFAIGCLPVLFAPATIAGVIGSVVATSSRSVDDAALASANGDIAALLGMIGPTLLFSVSLALIVLGESMLMSVVLWNTETGRSRLVWGARVAWSGAIIGTIAALAFSDYTFSYWGWLGYSGCCILVFALPALAGFIDEKSRRNPLERYLRKGSNLRY